MGGGILCLNLPILAQNNNVESQWDYEVEEEKSSISRFFTDLVSPQIIIDVRIIRAYVRDPRFRRFTLQDGDLAAVDGIFQKSLRLSEYEIQRTLFLCLMACIDHRQITVKIPLVGPIEIPLTAESDSAFASRFRNVPSQIYPDSPKSTLGDKDKLQHFFASAYLTYTSGSSTFSNFTGNLIEWGEARFIVGGDDDPRDKQANAQGERFGKALLNNKNPLPSEFLTKVD